MSENISTQVLCSVCNEEVPYNRGRRSGDNPICNKHLLQMKRHGRILERTIRDKNEIIIIDNHAEIVLRNRQQKEVGRAFVSIEQLEKVKDLKWSLHSGGYASCGTGTEMILLHRLVADAKDDEFIDHRNRNKLDCRDDNLRRCTKSQNAMNVEISKRNTSGTKGVWYDSRSCKWVAEIFVEGNKILLCRSKDKSECIIARLNAELEYFGEFTPVEVNSL